MCQDQQDLIMIHYNNNGNNQYLRNRPQNYNSNKKPGYNNILVLYVYHKYSMSAVPISPCRFQTALHRKTTTAPVCSMSEPDCFQCAGISQALRGGGDLSAEAGWI